MKNYNESGKTLLETIAVLVIIGLLTVGSMLGYSSFQNYSKRQQTVEQVLSLGTEFKVARVARVRPNKEVGVVRIKDLAPKGVLESDSALITADNPDGRITLETISFDSTAFTVTTTKLTSATCEAVLQSGGNFMVVADNESLTGGIEHKVFSSAYLKSNSDGQEVIKKVCQDQTQRLIWDDSCPVSGWSYFYNGQCWKCPKNQVEDHMGTCCAAVNECGYCPVNECAPHGTICDPNTKTCVECFKDHMGTRGCTDPAKPVCFENHCVECETPGVACPGDLSKFCLSNHTCLKCDTTFMRFDPANEMCVCKTEPKVLGEVCSMNCGCGTFDPTLMTPLYCVNSTDEMASTGVCTECENNYNADDLANPRNCGIAKPVCSGVGDAKSCQACTPSGENGVCYGLDSCCQSGMGCVSGHCCMPTKVWNETAQRCECPNGTVWNSTVNRCMACATDADCIAQNPSKPVCDLGICVQCTADYHCLGLVSGQYQCSDAKVCVCPADTYFIGGKCLKCEPNTQNGCLPLWCKTATTTTATCVECLQSAHCANNTDGRTFCSADNVCTCPAGQIWNTTLNRCTECRVDADCKNSDRPFCSPEGMCIPCSSTQPSHHGEECSVTCGCGGGYTCINNQCSCPSVLPSTAGAFCNETCGCGNGMRCVNGQCSACPERLPDMDELCNGQCGCANGLVCRARTSCNENACVVLVCGCPATLPGLAGTNCNPLCGCANGLLCENGRCAACPSNLPTFGQSCTSACGCSGGYTCNNGTCGCPANLPSTPGATCDARCGCANEMSCIDGKCAACPSILPILGESCRANCGCRGGYSCTNGVCSCPSGYTNINGSCCADERVYSTGGALACCSSGTVIAGECCPADRVYTKSNGQKACCSTSEKAIDGTVCCPSSNTYSNVNGTCCLKSKTYTENGVKKCCNGMMYNNQCCPEGYTISFGRCVEACPTSLPTKGQTCKTDCGCAAGYVCQASSCGACCGATRYTCACPSTKPKEGQACNSTCGCASGLTCTGGVCKKKPSCGSCCCGLCGC